MLNKFVRVPAAGALAASLAVLTGVSAPGAADEAFFKDKTVAVIVPVGPGGTYHVYAQIVARHLANHIPGNPNVIVQNRPGAGGAVSAAYVAHAAPKDGTVIGKIVPGMLTDPLMRDVRYDATEFQYLGAIAARDFSLAVWHTAPVESWEDLKTTEVTFGATGRGASTAVIPQFVNGVLGTKMQIITGYASGGDINLAIERGEVQGRGNFYSGYTGVKPDWIKENRLRFLLTMGPEQPALDGVPRVRDLLEPGSIEAKVFGMLEASFNMGQAFYLAPDVPKDRVETLQKAFWDAMTDPALKAEAEQRRVDYGPISAADMRRIVDDGMKPAEDPEVVKKFREIMGGGSS